MTFAARVFAFAALAALPFAALADDYADVNQLVKNGQPAAALAKAEQYIAAKPRDPQMRFLRGVILAQAGRTQDAIAAYTQLTQDFPELPEPWNNLAVLYASDNEYDKAREALETAIRANPSYATAHENLGDVYVKLASRSYAKAQQLGATGTAPAKLALARELLTSPRR